MPREVVLMGQKRVGIVIHVGLLYHKRFQRTTHFFSNDSTFLSIRCRQKRQVHAFARLNFLNLRHVNLVVFLRRYKNLMIEIY